MIEIKLTDKDAQEYLDRENHKDEVISNLTEQLIELRLQLSRHNPTPELPMTTSMKVRHDTDMLKGLNTSTPKSISPFGKLPEVTPNYITGPYTEQDLALITARMSKSDINQNRSLTSISKSLNREPTALRSKLGRLGIQVIKGMCYYKD